MAYENQGEQLRQRSVEDVINAHNLISEIGTRDVGNRLSNEQANRIALLNPGAAESQSAQSAAHRASAVHALQQAASAADLTPLNKAHLQAQIEQLTKTLPGTVAQQAATLEQTKAQTTRMLELTPLEKQHLDIQNSSGITANEKTKLELQNQKLLGTLPVLQQEQLLAEMKNKNQTYLDMKFPDKDSSTGYTTARVTSAEILQSQNRIASQTQQQQNHSDMLKHQQHQTEIALQAKDEKSRESAAESLAKILGNSRNPAVTEEINIFNANSTGNEIYHYGPAGTLGKMGVDTGLNSSAQKYGIPKVKIEGKVIQMNAKRLTRQASKLGLTPKEYLDKLTNSGMVVK